jgi:hypothetical protein
MTMICSGGARVQVMFTGPPEERVLLQHYRIDDTHSNSYTVWKGMIRKLQRRACMRD